MGQITGSVRMTGFIAPTDSLDTYPVTKPEYGLGGYRSVTNLVDRDTIPAERKEQGMLVYVQADKTVYILDAWDGSTGTWKVFVKGGSDSFTRFTTAINDASLAPDGTVIVLHQLGLAKPLIQLFTHEDNPVLLSPEFIDSDNIKFDLSPFTPLVGDWYLTLV